MQVDREALGRRFRELSAPAGSQTEVAKLIGSEQSRISWWCQGYHLAAMTRHGTELVRLLGPEMYDVLAAVARLSELEGIHPTYWDSRVALHLDNLQKRNGSRSVRVLDLLQALNLAPGEANWLFSSLYRRGLLGRLELRDDD